jgi:hypothetical protein
MDNKYYIINDKYFGFELFEDILKAIKERYLGLSTLKLAMWEDEDTVLVNLCDDLNDKFTEEEILKRIKELLK